MQTSIESSAAINALTAFIAGPAAAIVLQGDLNRDIHSTLSSDSNVFASVDNNGVVTLSGYFANSYDKRSALRVALKCSGVERLINKASVDS